MKLSYNLIWVLVKLPHKSDGKESVCNAGDLGSIPGSGRSPGERNGSPLQYSCLENPVDSRVWHAIVHRVARVGHVQFNAVTQSCLTLCDPMNCSMPGLPVHHQLLEFTQTHVHWVGDAIQPSHPLSSPSPPAFNLSQHQGLSKWVSSLWTKYWSFSFNTSPSNERPGLISFKMD